MNIREKPSVPKRHPSACGSSGCMNGAPMIKRLRLTNFVNGLYPGRWDLLRPATSQELKATTVLDLPLTEASAEIRSGPPKDDEEDYALPIWAGVIPTRMQVLQPVDDPRNLKGILPPEHATTLDIG